MKKIAWIVGAVLAVALGVVTPSARAAEGDGKAPVPQKAQTKCPVEGGKIDKRLFVDYDGKRVYFCCKGCPEEFEKDPAKYMRKLEAAGVKLERAPADKPTAPATTAPSAAGH